MNQKTEALACKIQKLKDNDKNKLNRTWDISCPMQKQGSNDLEIDKISLITVINILQNEHCPDEKPGEKRNEGKQPETNKFYLVHI